MSLSVSTLSSRAIEAVSSWYDYAIGSGEEYVAWPPSEARARLEYARLGHLLYRGQHAEPLDAPTTRYEVY
ncbi:MAG: hypothetical protein ACOYIG_11665, partial [Acetivibrionales bacterium]